MGNIPFLLEPVGKDYLWGGSRLNDDYKKNIDMFPLAETWECSAHPDGPSLIATGEFKGQSLLKLLADKPELLGKGKSSLPILIKLIDANKDLSVQVHPSDEYALAHEEYSLGNKERPLGKTEMWYVLDAREGAELVYGLSHDCSPDEIRSAIEKRSIGKYLNRVKVKKGDIFFIEPGTIHAIGAGILLAEVQENSNLTYRLYDYDRIDKNGNKRPLHIDKALDVARLESSVVPKQPIRVLKYAKGMASEVLCRCKYFEVQRLIINTINNEAVLYEADVDSYSVLLCVDGEGKLSTGTTIKKGQCLFVPADSEPVFIEGRCEFIRVRG